MRLALIGRFTFLLVLVAARVAHAAEPAEAECGASGAPFLLLETRGLAPELDDAVRRQVRASFASRALDLCVGAAAPGGRALAALAIDVDDALHATLTIGDAVTRKRVARELALEAVPEDGRAIALALALDELVRASWAEILLPDAPVPTPVPPIVAKIVTPSPAPSPARAAFGVALGFERFAEGHDQLGPDLAVSYRLAWRAGVHARLGARHGFAVEAPRGEVRSSALQGSVGVAVALLPAAHRFGLDLLAEALVMRVSFVADARVADARGDERSAVAAYLSAGVRGSMALAGPIRAVVRVGAGAPLHAARARDGVTPVTGVAGLLVGGDAGVAIVF